MVHDAVGVLSRFPVMMKAGANTLTGFLNETALPLRENTSSQLPSCAQAPTRPGSTAAARDKPPEETARASRAIRAIPAERMRCTPVQPRQRPPSAHRSRAAAALLD